MPSLRFLVPIVGFRGPGRTLLAFCLLGPILIGCDDGKVQDKPAPQVSLIGDYGDWKYISMYDSGTSIKTTYYIYGYSRDMVIVAPDGTVSMWFKHVPIELERPEGPPKPETLSYLLLHEEADCKKGIMRTLAMRSYNWNGKVMEQTVVPTEWSPIAPETVGYSEYSATCKAPEKVADDAWKFLKGIAEFFRKDGSDKKADSKDSKVK